MHTIARASREQEKPGAHSGELRIGRQSGTTVNCTLSRVVAIPPLEIEVGQ